MSSLPLPPDRSEVSPPPRSYACGVCPASFRRREHFERHVKGHSQNKDFKCDICKKEFARRDTLQRHATLHGQTPTKVHKTLPRASRACVACVKSKQRCSGLQPCDRCSRKGWHCQFTKGSKEAQLQELDVFSSSHGAVPTGEATPSANSNHNTPNSSRDRQCEMFNAWGLSPISSNHADLAFSGHPQSIPDNDALGSIFDSFLLWPLDDASEQYPMSSLDPAGIPISFDLTEPTHQPIDMAFALDTPEEHSAQVNEAHVSSGHQSDLYNLEDKLTQEDRDILISEDYGHVQKPSIATYQQICAHYAETRELSPEPMQPALYPLDILHVCTQLYFEHFHPTFPILHRGSFEPRSSSWLLYIAVAALGSQYSRLASRHAISRCLMKAIRMSILQKLGSTSPFQTNLELAQATLLFNFGLLFGGKREGVMHLQYQRNMLVTMCRPLLSHGVLFAKSGMLSDASSAFQDWTKWVTTESWKRLVHFAWLNECFQLILFDLPPLFTPGEMHLSMPCDDDLWQCSNAHDWQKLNALRRDLAGGCSVASLLRTHVIDQESIHSVSDLALWISISAVYISDRQFSQAALPSFCSNASMYSTQPFRNEPQSPGFTAETPPQDLDLDQVDTILTTLSEIPQQRRNSPLSLTITKFCLIFKILRFVEYRYLYVASGWMAQGQEIKAACQYIGHLFKKKPKNTRQCLLHAAQLFRIIRSQGQFEPYDSFFLLMATLYIWNYDRFVVSDTPQCLGGGVSQTDAIIRIDQHMSQDLKEKWISGTTETPKLIHISGLGALNGHDSVSRVLRESARILSHDKAWATMAHALKYSLLQMASGATPSFSAEGNNQ